MQLSLDEVAQNKHHSISVGQLCMLWAINQHPIFLLDKGSLGRKWISREKLQCSSAAGVLLVILC